MVEQGVTRFIEVGPKDVLGKLVSRIEPGAEAISIGSLPEVQTL
jgi:malonyl CoA-acyl carrier protein transacylase